MVNQLVSLDFISIVICSGTQQEDEMEVLVILNQQLQDVAMYYQLIIQIFNQDIHVLPRRTMGILPGTIQLQAVKMLKFLTEMDSRFNAEDHPILHAKEVGHFCCHMR